jgi:hypothetical protein
MNLKISTFALLLFLIYRCSSVQALSPYRISLQEKNAGYIFRITRLGYILFTIRTYNEVTKSGLRLGLTFLFTIPTLFIGNIIDAKAGSLSDIYPEQLEDINWIKE